MPFVTAGDPDLAFTAAVLRELANAGLLERKRKAGTRVALNPVSKATLDIAITRLEVEARGAAYHHVVLERKKTTPPSLIASKMDLSAKSKILNLRTLHLADNQPFLYEVRWINPAAVPQVFDVDFGEISANEWLVQNAPFTTGDISFSAANANAKEAEHLAIKQGEALFVVERTTRIGSKAITSVRLAYAPGFKMHTTI
jgi:GntR family histidine utilization transcriptional repressor